MPTYISKILTESVRLLNGTWKQFPWATPLKNYHEKIV